jgi:hypothetical protein
MNSGHIADFYDYLWQLPENSPERNLYPADLFNYPPAVYFTLGPLASLTSLPFSEAIKTDFIFNVGKTFGNVELNFLLLALKIPYLIFDLAIIYFLMNMFTGKRERLLVAALWAGNPVNLYATYMMGQFDIIPTFFMVWVLSRVLKNNVAGVTDGILLGLGAAFKIFPALLLVPLALTTKSWWKRAAIMLSGIAVYFLTILPFLGSAGFRQTALVAGQTSKSLYPQIAVSGGQAIMLFPAAIIFVYLAYYFGRVTGAKLWLVFFLLLLVFFIFTHTHPQWFLWLTPLIILDLLNTNLRTWPLASVSLISFIFLVTFFDPGLSTWLFAPLFPSLYGVPGIWELVGINIDINFARSIFHSLFVGAALFYMYSYFPRQKNAET